MYSTVRGKPILPFDGRSLEFKIANVKNADIKFDDSTLNILNPKNCWENKEEYQKMVEYLAKLFLNNMDKYEKMPIFDNMITL